MKHVFTFATLCVAILLTAAAAIPTPDRCVAYYVDCTDTAIEQESDWEMFWDLRSCQRTYNQCMDAATKYN